MPAPGTDRGRNARVLRFGTFELDLGAGELRRSGVLVKLQSQHLQLLVLLLDHAGRVVTREVIRRTLWGNETFVDFDRGINFSINQIRAALDDDPRSPRFVETLPRKGYRFIAPVGALESGAWYGAGAAKPIRSLAVLPLENLSHDPEQEYFAEGMTDELITALAKIGALRVVSRTSVMQYRGTKKTLAEIARELSVDALVAGAVLRAQNRVRITAQLIRATPEEHLWAERYEGNLEEVLTLQNTVAQDVARSIKINVTPRERKLLATPYAVDPTAYEACLKGRYLWGWGGEDNLLKSCTYFEQAIEQDPAIASAWAGLAGAYQRLSSWGVLSNEDALPRARAAADKALELDSTLVEPLGTLATVKMNYEWDWVGAGRLCNQAIELNPGCGEAHHVYATYLAEVGRMQEAVAEAQRARDAEPLSLVYAANVAWKLYLAHRHHESELEWRRAVDFFPNFTGGYGLASLYLKIGRTREAIVELQKDADSHREMLKVMYLGHGLGVSGARTEARKVLEEMQSLSQRRYVSPMYIAIVYEGLGERERALQSFEKAYSERAINGWILPDPRLDPIRAEPRFNALMRRMGLSPL